MQRLAPVFLTGALLIGLPLAFGAEPRWIQSNIGPLELVSDAPNKQALEILGTFEQFRNALGETVGKRDLTTHPSIRLLVLKAGASSGAPAKAATTM